MYISTNGMRLFVNQVNELIIVWYLQVQETISGRPGLGFNWADV